MKETVKDGSTVLEREARNASKGRANPSWIKTRLSGPGAVYNAGNVLALGAGIVLSLYEVWGQSSFSQALYGHLMGSPEAAWLSTSMILFIVSGEIYHRAYQPNAHPRLVHCADFVAGVAAIALTVAMVKLGDTRAALLSGLMLTFGKIGSAVLPWLSPRDPMQLDPKLRLTVVASRIPAILSLGLAILPAFQGTMALNAVLLPLIMIICFLMWLWADFLLLLKR